MPELATDLDLIDEALDTLGSADSIERASLLCARAMNVSLGYEIATKAEYDLLLRTAEEGFAMAGGLGDVTTRIETARNLLTVLAGGPNVVRYLDVAREMADLLDAAFPIPGDAGAWLVHATGSALATGGQLAGDPQLVSEGISRLEELAVRYPWTRAALLRMRAGIALAGGKLAEAGELADTMRAVGESFGAYRLIHGDITTTRAFLAGDVDLAIERTTRALKDGSVHHRTPELLADLAAFLAANGSDDAATTLTSALERGLPWNVSRQRALWRATEAAARLADAEAATMLVPLVAPYDGTIFGGYSGFTIDGSAATSLGQLETVLGCYDEADTHFRAGIAIEERMGHTALAARSRMWWARMLLTRGHPQDRAAGHDLLREAGITAERLGLGLLARDVKRANEASRLDA